MILDLVKYYGDNFSSHEFEFSDGKKLSFDKMNDIQILLINKKLFGLLFNMAEVLSLNGSMWGPRGDMACDNYEIACQEIDELLPLAKEIFYLSEHQIIKRSLIRLDRSTIISNRLPSEKDVKEVIETDIGIIIRF